VRDPREQFGPAAEKYLSSAVHSNPDALSRIIEVVQPSGGTVVDVATGAGHTAYAFSPYVDRVIATDITPDMLRVTKQTAQDRGLDNLSVLFAIAEYLPFQPETLEGISCRLGAHHFTNVHSFARESARSLKKNGWLVIADTIGSEDDETDEKIDTFERTRDPSHVRNLRRTDWLKILLECGFSVIMEETSPKEIDAEDWMDRMKVSPPDRFFLKEMIDDANGEFARYLDSSTRDGKLIFHLDEILLFARKS
jgi:ubiquinone/menaquinone biosynthesis C-methylase UbiE